MAFDMEAELRDLCARRDINDALCRYMRGQDRLDPVLHRSAFHDDAWVDCGLMNGTADEFVAFAQGFLADIEGSQHIIGQVQLSINGDAASGEVYFYAWHRITEEGEPKDLIVAGRYIDEYACRDGDWRIVRRRELIDWARTDPAADAFLQAHDLPRGARRGADFGQTRDWPV
ncbi:nuclear transport factor 2 family protein [Novosphingobium sp. FSY-8]|uniref:Nuclear transport factor 2 family protein n=1 Tax=Novosphingobium ovatum TaxID=1908523 RepID=A0ABW9XH15_9SPHN|nr:nuclear transport factor 2 family protein [Novosphingobium ovatum]NBC37781.1 nuclear transport factor 2 family protein [Novosphingobium ovatum]